MQESVIGVGPALRKARLHRGVTIDEASRDTKIRAEFLEALEEEDFDLLLGDVYVRGCLRSYSTYLGLPPDKVVAAYAKSLLHSSQPPAPAQPVLLEPVMGGSRRRDNHRLAFMVAAMLLVLAAAFGVLSKSRSAPAPAQLPASPPAVEAANLEIMAALLAKREVDVTITADGIAQTVTLRAGEGRSFDAERSLTIRLSSGNSVRLTVNGVDLGSPGKARRPWEETFGEPEASPSPTG